MKAHRSSITVWRPGDIGHVELRTGVRVSSPVPRHWHDEYQFCLIEAGAGELLYRRSRHDTPPASLFLVCPGEVHSNRPFHAHGCSYRTLFIEPLLLTEVVCEMSDRSPRIPSFASAVVQDSESLARFLALHRTLEATSSTLEREGNLHDFLAFLILRYAEEKPSVLPRGRERLAVRRVRDYLSENFAENVRSDELAKIAGLSTFHLSRVFTSTVGLPPHAFQTQLRIAHAKVLLRTGMPISQVAAQTGFADQSHLTRHFKRSVALTPGRYQQSVRS